MADYVRRCGRAENEGLKKMAKGDITGAMSLIRYTCCVPGHGGNGIEYQQSSNGVLSLPKQTLDEAVAEILKG